MDTINGLLWHNLPRWMSLLIKDLTGYVLVRKGMRNLKYQWMRWPR